jgi:hypothetical protein
LLGTATLGFTDGLFHRLGHAIGIQNGAAIEVTRCAANGLNQAALGAQEALFVGVQNGHQ